MGGVELAAALASRGVRAAVAIGPTGPAPLADALVVALDSRSIPAREARAQSLAALGWLREAGCERFFFNYGPAFDSTDDGNIGPVADALVDALGCGFALACPAAPGFARTVYQGHLFFGPALLHESGLQRHPVTPMRDANLVRVLSRQTDGTVGLVPFATVLQGAAAIRRAMLAMKEQGRRYVVVDAVTAADLASIATAACDQPLVTGGPALGAALAPGADAVAWSGAMGPGVAGHAAVLAGSCARATLFQLGQARDRVPTLELDLVTTPDAAALASQALAWAEQRLGAAPVVIATSTTPDRVAALATALGPDAASALVRDVHCEVAKGLVALGVRRLLVAGSETSRVVVESLGLRRLMMEAEIDPGVAWALAEGTGPAMLLALKPGERGGRGLFAGAFQMLADG